MKNILFDQNRNNYQGLNLHTCHMALIILKINVNLLKHVMWFVAIKPFIMTCEGIKLHVINVCITVTVKWIHLTGNK